MPPLAVVELLDVLEDLTPRLPARAQAASCASSTFTVAKKLSATRCPSSCRGGSCCRRSHGPGGPADSRRWRTGCPDPSDEAVPAGAPSAEGHGQRLQGEVPGDPRAQGPAHDGAREEIENDSQVQPALLVQR